jgi:hypothetical protein
MKRGPFTLAHFPEWEQTTISLSTLALWRLGRNPVHGSRASPRTGLLDRKLKFLPVRPEHVEGLRANCDTVSWEREG